MLHEKQAFELKGNIFFNRFMSSFQTIFGRHHLSILVKYFLADKGHIGTKGSPEDTILKQTKLQFGSLFNRSQEFLTFLRNILKTREKSWWRLLFVMKAIFSLNWWTISVEGENFIGSYWVNIQHDEVYKLKMKSISMLASLISILINLSLVCSSRIQPLKYNWRLLMLDNCRE